MLATPSPTHANRSIDLRHFGKFFCQHGPDHASFVPSIVDGKGFGSGDLPSYNGSVSRRSLAFPLSSTLRQCAAIFSSGSNHTSPVLSGLCAWGYLNISNFSQIALGAKVKAFEGYYIIRHRYGQRNDNNHKI